MGAALIFLIRGPGSFIDLENYLTGGRIWNLEFGIWSYSGLLNHPIRHSIHISLNDNASIEN
jgi:hypothetical protein